MLKVSCQAVFNITQVSDLDGYGLKTIPLMGATRLASGKYAAIINSSSARILTPISIPKQDASPPLEVAFSAFGLLLTSSAAVQQFKQA